MLGTSIESNTVEEDGNFRDRDLRRSRRDLAEISAELLAYGTCDPGKDVSPWPKTSVVSSPVTFLPRGRLWHPTPTPEGPGGAQPAPARRLRARRAARVFPAAHASPRWQWAS